MSRALNIALTDEIVFKAVLGVHQDSHLLREEVKRRVLGAKYEQEAATQQEIDETRAKIRRLEKQVAQTQDLLGIVDGKYDLKELPKKTYESRRRVITQAIERLETEINNARLAVRGSEAEKRWVDWVGDYGKMIEGKRSLSREQKKEYISGMVQRIDVRYVKASDEHELALHFRLPIVSDQYKRHSPQAKRRYNVRKGTQDLLLRIDKKALKNLGKVVAPEQNQNATVE